MDALAPILLWPRWLSVSIPEHSLDYLLTILVVQVEQLIHCVCVCVAGQEH